MTILQILQLHNTCTSCKQRHDDTANSTTLQHLHILYVKNVMTILQILQLHNTGTSCTITSLRYCKLYNFTTLARPANNVTTILQTLQLHNTCTSCKQRHDDTANSTTSQHLHVLQTTSRRYCKLYNFTTLARHANNVTTILQTLQLHNTCTSCKQRHDDTANFTTSQHLHVMQTTSRRYCKLYNFTTLARHANNVTTILQTLQLHSSCAGLQNSID